jgi:hypothetical protein
MMKKYPPGPHESVFISEMMNEYQTRLEAKSEADSSHDSFDVESDFSKFQDEYLNRIPSEQVFADTNGHFMSIKEIIIEERRKAGRPEEMINKIGIKIFVENTAEGAGAKMAAIEDAYIGALEELKKMQQNPGRRNKTRVHNIRRQFEREEPYHRCGPAPHQFYSNYAAVVLLDDEEAIDFVVSLLDRSLAYKPDYDRALKMKRDLQDYDDTNGAQ